MKKTVLVIFASLVAALALPVHAAKTTGERVDDGVITSTIKAGLLDNQYTSSMSINVESYTGTVQLSGFVSSQQEKDAAGKVATGVNGVKKVINSLSIAPQTSMSTKLDDTVMTGKVKAALMDDAHVKSMQINVESRNGVTQLAGFVADEAMRERAGKVAAGVSGVKKLDNALVVKPTE